MRDAIGGLVNVQLIIIFILIINGYLAFSVNYTKAFRVKNKIITTIEQYEGLDGAKKEKAEEDIRNYMRQVGYTAPTNMITSNGTDYPCSPLGYCYKEVDVSATNGKGKRYYKVSTFINIDIPIINKILPNIKAFQVSGDTKILYK